MCYICSPRYTLFSVLKLIIKIISRQYKFYGKERLTVCYEFCEEFFNACGEAVLKGSKISEIYLNGSEFCKSRRFNVDFKRNDNCFYYNIDERKYLNGKNTMYKTNLLYFPVILSVISNLFIFLIINQ
jgi:hypothetical protein